MKKRKIFIALALSVLTFATACSSTKTGSEDADSGMSVSVSADQVSAVTELPEVKPGQDETGKWVGYSVYKDMSSAGLSELMNQNRRNDLIYDGRRCRYRLEYRYRQDIGEAKPDMRKITVDEIKEIVNVYKAKMSSADNDSFFYQDKDFSVTGCRYWMENAIRRIQAIPDANYQYKGSDKIPLYNRVYWPDSDTLSDRRTEIQTDWVDDFRIRIFYFDDDRNVVDQEILFDYKEEYDAEKKRRISGSEELQAHSPDLDSNGKWTGRAVYVSEDPKDRPEMTQEQSERLAELDKDETYDYIYQRALARGTAKPDMRKITIDEFKEIIEDLQTLFRSESDHDFFRGDSCFHYEAWNYVLQRVHEIQGISDACYKNTGYDTYVFWVDGDTPEQRRTEIVLPCSVNRLNLYVQYYDENGDRIPDEKGGKQELFSFDQFMEEETQRRIGGNKSLTSEGNGVSE